MTADQGPKLLRVHFGEKEMSDAVKLIDGLSTSLGKERALAILMMAVEVVFISLITESKGFNRDVVMRMLDDIKGNVIKASATTETLRAH